MKKVTPEELNQLTTFRTEYATLRNRLCDITLTEEKLKLDKQTTLANISQMTGSINELYMNLQEKYGEGDIDLVTGEINGTN